VWSFKRLPMNVVVENQPNCLATLSVELPADRVTSERNAVTENFRKVAKIPGFRPGKAPRPMVSKRYAKEIHEELSDKLLRSALSEAVKEKSLKVLSVSKVDGPTFHPDDTASFTATVVLEPEFDLPDYSTIPAGLKRDPVSEDNVKEAMDAMRERHGTFQPVEGRELSEGDFAVVSYAAKIDGKPMTEVVPEAPPQLSEKKNAWLLIEDNPMMPGFAKALAGMKPGDSKTVEVAFPADYSTQELAGKSASYDVTLEDIQERVLPEWDDELAAKILPESTVESLREKVLENLEGMSDRRFLEAKQKAAMDFLLNNVECEVPESFVERETQNLLGEIVRENQARGVSDDELAQNHEQIVGAAQEGAAKRVRGNFLLSRVAEKEKIEVGEQDLTQELVQMSYQYNIPAKKLMQDIRKRNALPEIRDNIRCRKALELLVANVTVDESAQPEPAKK